jgi:cbb3-type cytochrome oxidase subunit 3
LKYISLKYLNYGFKEKREIEKANNTFKGYPSEIVCDKIWVEIHEVTTIYIRFWFKNILDLMSTCLNDYVNKMRLIHITIFIILIIIIIFAYCIVWKNYEHKLKNMLDKSFNLINLIPDEIKYMIIRKLNE